MSYQVLIPCAGIGSRLRNETKLLNKSLIHIKNKPIISHILEKFPNDCEFIIPVGYRGKDLIDYLNIAHKDRKFIYENISPYEGEGSSLGYTLSKVVDNINDSFVFISCDTLVAEEIPSPELNWIGYSQVSDSSDYRTLEIKNGKILKLNEKLQSNTNNAYIGLAGISNYEDFKEFYKSNKSEFYKKGESYPLSKMISQFKAQQFTWFDTGSIPGLNNTRLNYESNKNVTHNILEKEDEKIWFTSNKVIKFSGDESFIQERIERSKILQKYVPKITDEKKNMYSYDYVSGDVLSSRITTEIFDKLLNMLEGFWEKKELSDEESLSFSYSCHEFYKDKTFQRIEGFLNTYPFSNKDITLNGKKIESPYTILEKLDWKYLSKGIPVVFHGDLHFENILYDSKKFIFLDWRQNFNGLLQYGDIYYDLAKLLHGILLPHKIVVDGLYSISESEDDITIDIKLPDNYLEIYDFYINWLKSQDFDVDKVHTLCALIYLNISPLHHHPYSRFLFYYGLELLDEYVK